MTTEATQKVDADWRRYGEALLHSMADVRSETPEDIHAVLMETADYWLSIGLAIGSSDPKAAMRLLHLIESEEPERAELHADAAHFVSEALG